MTNAYIDCLIEVTPSQAEAISEALSVCMRNFSDQSCYCPSREFSKFFPPSVTDQPLSGLWSMFDPASIGYSGKEYEDADARLISHNDDAGEYRIVANNACVEAVVAILGRACAANQKIVLLWRQNDDNGNSMGEQDQVSVITRSGEAAWSCGGDTRADHPIAPDVRRAIKRGLAVNATAAAQLGRFARLTDAKDDVIETCHFGRNLGKAASTLCRNRHSLPIRAFTGWVTDDNVLTIDRLLSYSDHVAVMALIAEGYHRHQACIAIASGQAGAFRGSPEACPAYLRDATLTSTTTFPDGVEWTIWQSQAETNNQIVPIVNGWTENGLCDYDKMIGTTSPATCH